MSTSSLVARHRTALHRADLSRPIKVALESGLLAPGRTFFDYGCGRGGDVLRLRALGYAADGWDPHHRPDAPRSTADVVNLGYVLNVIEDPAERPVVLREAFSQTGNVLLISALLRDTRADDNPAAPGQPFRDGVLTRLGTFQKRFDQGELQSFIETALGTDALPVEPGVFAVFRHPEDLHGHLAARVRRRVDWDELRARLGLLLPPRAAPRERRHAADLLPDQHPELFNALRDLLLDLGRSPAPGEFPREAELLALPGLGRSLARAVRLVLALPGVAEAFTAARELRRGDHLVFLALANLSRRPASFRQLPLRVREDVRAFHGGPDWPRALARGRELLFAAGDPGEITLACDEFRVQNLGGWEDPDDRALIVHRSLLPALPPLLRVFAHCAAHRYGDPARADLIRLHKHSGKVSFLYYDGFNSTPLPALRQRIKVNLHTLFVQVFDYAGDDAPDHAPTAAEVSLLPLKERFLPRDHPDLPAMARVSARLRRAGFDETNVSHGLTPAALAAAGINVLTRAAADRSPRNRAAADRRKRA